MKLVELRINKEWVFDYKIDSRFNLDKFLERECIYNLEHYKGYTTFLVNERDNLLEYTEEELLEFFIELNKNANQEEKEYLERSRIIDENYESFCIENGIDPWDC